MDASKIVIRGARVLVKEQILSQETETGIVLPGREKEHTNQGIVLAVGDGAMLEDGTIVPVKVNVGDKVMYTAFSGSPIVKADDEDEEEKDTRYLILNERDILCIILPD
jgi:chaperonin GroES